LEILQMGVERETSVPDSRRMQEHAVVCVLHSCVLHSSVLKFNLMYYYQC
jgi:hypothetical protein